MGKASRIKRERQEERQTHPVHESRTRSFPVFWVAIAGLVVAAVAALAITAPSEKERAAAKKARGVPAFAEVVAEGASLPTWTSNDTADDPAIGKTVPALDGTDFDESGISLTPRDGVARVYVVVAHWCPHCRAEVPRIVEWAKDQGGVPAGVEIVGISTAVSDSQDNYPPAEWLAREEWPWEVLIDDEVGSAASALGMEGFPFIVFADRQGKVVQRFSGEMPIADFDAAVSGLASPPRPAGK